MTPLIYSDKFYYEHLGNSFHLTHVILHELGEKNFLDVHSKICQNKSGESFQKLFPTLNANGLKNIPLNNLDIQKYIKDISDRRRIEAANCF